LYSLGVPTPSLPRCAVTGPNLLVHLPFDCFCHAIRVPVVEYCDDARTVMICVALPTLTAIPKLLAEAGAGIGFGAGSGTGFGAGRGIVLVAEDGLGTGAAVLAFVVLVYVVLLFVGLGFGALLGGAAVVSGAAGFGTVVLFGAVSEGTVALLRPGAVVLGDDAVVQGCSGLVEVLMEPGVAARRAAGCGLGASADESGGVASGRAAVLVAVTTVGPAGVALEGRPEDAPRPGTITGSELLRLLGNAAGL
jgi:hypothetical protein